MGNCMVVEVGNDTICGDTIFDELVHLPPGPRDFMRKRMTHHGGKIKSFSKIMHFTALMTHMVGMSYFVCDTDRLGSKLIKKKVTENVSIVEVFPTDLQALTSVWAGHSSGERWHDCYKEWRKSTGNACSES